MQEALGAVIFVVVGLALVVGLLTLRGRGDAYDGIGSGGLSLDRRPPARETAAVREAEIRELLDARNERRARRGEAPLDVHAELARQLDDLG